MLRCGEASPGQFFQLRLPLVADLINEQSGADINAGLTFWRSCEPDLRAMKHLSDQQLGFTGADNDLICREQSPNFLCATQIVADWQWTALKKVPSLRYAEHHLSKQIEAMEQFIAEEEDD